jgi:hypothetical protein
MDVLLGSSTGVTMHPEYWSAMGPNRGNFFSLFGLAEANFFSKLIPQTHPTPVLWITLNVTEKAEFPRVYRGEYTPFICLDLRNFHLETVGYREYSSDRRQVGLVPYSKHKELEQVVCFGNVAIPEMRTPKRPRISNTPTTAGKWISYGCFKSRALVWTY